MRKSLLEVQTLPDATPPIGKIHTFRKIALNLNQGCNFDNPSDLEFLKLV